MARVRRPGPPGTGEADPAIPGQDDEPRADPFDPVYARELVEQVFDPIQRYYFRPRIIGAENLPENGPAVLLPNHSGNAFPYDGMVLDAMLWAREGFDPATRMRSVFEKELSTSWWMRPFGIDDFWRRCGGIDLTFDNFDRLLARGERLIYYPEGVPGIGKGFGHRYRLQRFSTSFALLCARHDAPVHPVYIVNAEWVIPFNYTFAPVDRLADKLFGVPFLPLPGAVLAVLFPFCWYLTLPARMTYVVGEAIDMRRVLAEEGIVDLDHPDRQRLQAAANRVRETMQPRLDRYVETYGRRPYHARLLWRKLRDARRRNVPILGHVLPTGWPATFVRFDRNRRRPPARNALHRLARDWDLVPYWLPLGWPLLTLARRLRRPPYGYRGLSKEERRRREGAFHWHLRDRPLPPRGSTA